MGPESGAYILARIETESGAVILARIYQTDSLFGIFSRAKTGGSHFGRVIFGFPFWLAFPSRENSPPLRSRRLGAPFRRGRHWFANDFGKNSPPCPLKNPKTKLTGQLLRIL
jgi:hypothetical protein